MTLSLRTHGVIMKLLRDKMLPHLVHLVKDFCRARCPIDIDTSATNSDSEYLSVQIALFLLHLHYAVSLFLKQNSTDYPIATSTIIASRSYDTREIIHSDFNIINK